MLQYFSSFLVVVSGMGQAGEMDEETTAESSKKIFRRQNRVIFLLVGLLYENAFRSGRRWNVVFSLRYIHNRRRRQYAYVSVKYFLFQKAFSNVI